MMVSSEAASPREHWVFPNACPTLCLHDADTASRAGVQRYIQRRYARAFGATLTEWMPTLVSLESQGRILAAAGYRAAVEPLFLEQYLDQPIERCLGFAGERSRIVEVGQFAADRPGDGRTLITPLVEHLADAGFVWVVMTVTRELKLLFERMGLTGRSLGPARDEVLSAAQRLSWGRYYQHSPVVVGGRVADILDRLDAR